MNNKKNLMTIEQLKMLLDKFHPRMNFNMRSACIDVMIHRVSRAEAERVRNCGKKTVSRTINTITDEYNIMCQITSKETNQ